MLTRTFCHIPGIGLQSERRLWEQGCLAWDTFADHPNDFSVGGASRAVVLDTVLRSRDALNLGEHQYFQRMLAESESWRAWPEFQDRCVYLDIETDGGSTGQSITTIGLYNGEEYRCLVKGKDLEVFRDAITHYSYLVTFFGTGFDLPMIRKRFRNLHMDQIHLDLCYALKQVGFRGGLKKIEKQLGIARGEDTDGLSGMDAVRLWREYDWGGREESLATLIAYNREDVVNLKTLAEIAYTRLKLARMGDLAGAPA